MGIWLELALCAAVIAAAGPVLVRRAEQIAGLTGMSRSWVGVILLAAATSLPELFTGLSSVTVANAPNVAVGDILGSCVFNLALIALLDPLSRDGPVFREVDQRHIVTASLGIILIGSVGALLLVAGQGLDLHVGHVSGYTPVLILLYVVAMRATYVHENHADTRSASHVTDRTALKRAVRQYLVAALIVGAAGVWLPFIATRLADLTGWRMSFVGTSFIAAATSLPEVIVTIAALRLKAVDLAIGGLLGSNLFDVLVLAIDDLAYTKGSLFAHASPAHAGSAFAATIMSGIVVITILDRPATRFFGVFGWASILLLAIYVMSSYSIYLLGH